MAVPPDHEADQPVGDGVRLQKLLASAGIDSRRKCEEYVVTGRVTVDGRVVTDPGFRADPETQDVRLDGERIRPQRKRYFLLNKPTGYLCTNYDPAGRRRAVDLVPAAGTRLFTVGRLDEGSQGLLLVTNDGDVAQRLAHPRFQVPRIYRLQVAGIPTAETLAELRKGVHFTEGRFGLKRTKRLKTHGNSAFLEVELNQGQNREIRRLFARVGHKVMWLQRVSFGPLKLGDLPVGRFRPLKPDEVKALHGLASGSRQGTKAKPGRRPGAGKRRPQPEAVGRPRGRLILGATGGGGGTPQPSEGAARGTRKTKSRAVTGSPARPLRKGQASGRGKQGGTGRRPKPGAG